MDRKDIHRPSVIVPADYEFIAFAYLRLDSIEACSALQSERAIFKAHQESTGGQYATHEHGGSCHVCGANAIYTVIFYHAATNTYIQTGQDCALKMEMPYNEFRYNAFRKGITDARLAVAGKRKAEALLNDKGFGAAWAIYTQTDATVTAAYQYEEKTIVDIIGKQVAYGSISERAMNYIGVLLNKIEKRAEIEAKRAAEAALAQDVPTGRLQITGEIVSTRVDDTPYGRQLKMLVKDDRGFKVWGSAPSSISADKGDRITFSAQVEPSNDDKKFGFFKRPTKAQTLVPAADESVAADHSYFMDGQDNRTIIVACTECGVDYDEKETEVLDIEEDIQGRDVLTFKCPKGHHCKSLRRG